MEELKHIWNQQDLSRDHLKTEEVKPLLTKKSKSVAKWILIISLIEFILPNLIYLFIDTKSIDHQYEIIGLNTFMKIITFINYAVALGFIFVFFKNYKRISMDQSVKQLMKSIVNTRKVVKSYIYYNLISLSFINLIVIVVIFSDYDKMIEYFQIDISQTPVESIWLTLLIATIVVMALAVLLLWLFYRITYGYLLKRLLRNYKEISANKKED